MKVDIEQYLKKFKISYPQSLFMNWDMLKENRCPICMNKLKFPLNKKIAYCKGRKHNKTFVIKIKHLERLNFIFK